MTLVPTNLPAIDIEFDERDVPDSLDFDEIIDLTDRRRVLVRLVFGLDLDAADDLFATESDPP